MIGGTGSYLQREVYTHSFAEKLDADIYWQFPYIYREEGELFNPMLEMIIQSIISYSPFEWFQHQLF